MNGSIDADVRLVGQRIAVRRIDAGYSQEKFAEMVGISKTALGKIERGDSAPKPRRISTGQTVSSQLWRTRIFMNVMCMWKDTRTR